MGKHKRTNRPRSSSPSEHDEQVALFQWAALNKRRLPDLGLMFAIPNGGKRPRGEAGKLKAEGVKPGVPDILLPVRRHGFGGLFIEMKSLIGSVRPEQRQWLEALRQKGYRVETCRGFDAARAVLEEYLGG